MCVCVFVRGDKRVCYTNQCFIVANILEDRWTGICNHPLLFVTCQRLKRWHSPGGRHWHNGKACRHPETTTSAPPFLPSFHVVSTSLMGCCCRSLTFHKQCTTDGLTNTLHALHMLSTHAFHLCPSSSPCSWQLDGWCCHASEQLVEL